MPIKSACRTGLVFAVIVGLSGCATSFKNPSGLAFFDATEMKPDRATIFLSTAAEKTCLSSYPVDMLIKNVESGKTVAGFNLNNQFNKSDIEPTEGRDAIFVSAKTLDPGDYTVEFKFTGAQTTQTPTANFSVRAGDAVYLGEFLFAGACGAFVLNNEIEISDMSARDFSHIRQFNPAVKESSIEIRVLEFAEPLRRD